MCCFDLRFNNLLKVTITNVFVIIRFSVRGVLVTNTPGILTQSWFQCGVF